MNKEQEAVRLWLESAEGEKWSRAHHKTSGNQVDLVTLKEADMFENKTVMWKSAMTVPTDWPWAVL